MNFNDVIDAYDEIFNPFEEDWSNIEISECNQKNNCFINRTEAKNQFIKEIKLTNNPQVNVYCQWSFFKSSINDKYIPRPTFCKRDNKGKVRQRSTQKIIVDIDESEYAEKFWEMISFINNYKDLVDISKFDGKYKIVEKNTILETFDSYEEKEKVSTIKEIIDNNNIPYNKAAEILNNPKKKALEQFHTLLWEDETNEATWQEFFQNNDWIFAGLSLKLFFGKDVIREADLGVKSTGGTDSPKVDYLCVDDYTTLVEIKTPKTKIFSKNKQNTARTNTWSFSSHFLDGISQCLGQKASWEAAHNIKQTITNDDEILDCDKHRTKNPKSIFIIGNKTDELNLQSKKIDDITKRDTFELFRRNCSNVEIITFDELYERAKYIVEAT